MRSESLEALSRELNVPAHRLSGMGRPRPAAESALKERERDARDAVSMMENGAIEMLISAES
jgi:transposase